MNKYVVRTSLVWIGIVVTGVGGFLFYRSRNAGLSARTRLSKLSMTSVEQPVAEGPALAGPKAPMEAPLQASLTPVQITPQRMQSIGVETGVVEYKQLDNDVRASGNVEVDERQVAYVQVRFAGYIRKVFANATYLYVRKGEPLFTVYSPDVVATQEEYLLARANEKTLSTSSVDGVAAGGAALAAAAEERLQQWQVPESEIARLRETGKPITDLTINSPASGYITEYNALPNLYVEPSTRLYTVADLSSVWVYAQVFQEDVGRLRPGGVASVTVDSYPGETFTGRIESILPQVDLATRTVRVRLTMANHGMKLKPGMFVNVELKSPLGRQLTVPASAVFQTGTRAVVFLDQGGGYFNPQEVVLGPRAGDEYVVLKGLKARQKIVTSANFLIDSESQLEAASGSFSAPQADAGNSSSLAKSTSSAQATIDFTSEPNPPHKGGNLFRVKLTHASGAPVSGAQVAVTFYMPAMAAMGMAAMKMTVTLSDKGNGLYEGQGNLGSGGNWQTTITAQQNGKVLASKALDVNVEGGM